MNKIIDFQILARIIRHLDRIFEIEDSHAYYGKSVTAYGKMIDTQLKKLNADKQMIKDIYETHCPLDGTYEAQCDRLRARGYTIVNNKIKGE